VVATGVVGWFSHYAMDLVPHGHYPFNKESISRTQKLVFAADFVLPITALGIYLLMNFGLGKTSWLVGAGVLGAQLPDLLMGLRSKGILPHGFWGYEAKQHSRTHWHNPKIPAQATPEGGRPLGWTDVWQAVMAVLAVWALLTV
jgi:hypothetical protein